MYATLLFLNIIIRHICPSVLHEIWIPVTGHVTQTQLVTFLGYLLFQVHLNIFLQFFTSFISIRTVLKHNIWVSVHISIHQIRFAVSSMTQWSSIAPLFPLSEVVLASLLALSLSLSAGISASRTACFWYVVTGSTTLPSVHCLLFLKFSSFLTLRLSHPNRWRQMVTLPVAGSAGDCFLLKGYFSSPLFPSACSQGNNRISPIILSRTVLLTFVGKLHWMTYDYD